MKLLIDTQIFLWLVDDAPQLSSSARQLLIDAEEVHVSSVSLWEIAIKVNLGKLQVDQDRLDAEADLLGLRALATTARHARAVRSLPFHHTDPFDRLLVAQAMSEPLHFMTHDAVLRAYSPFVVVV